MGPLGWDQAAAELKWTGRHRGRRLKHYVLRREKQTGEKIALRVGTPRKPAYRVTMGALHQYCSELFEKKSKVDSLQAVMTAHLKQIDERIAMGVAEHVEDFVEPRFQELWERDEKIAEQVSELASRVAILAGAQNHRP